jgi:hypothetical protein
MQQSLSNLRPLALLGLAALASCNSTSPRSSEQAYARGTRLDAGTSLRAMPDEGTRYLTAVGQPNLEPVTLPDWVVNPTLDGVLGAIGVAERNELGTSHQIDNARASARLEVARMLEVRVQDIGRRDIEQHIVANKGQVADMGSNKSLLGVDRNIADMVLSGSRQRALWFDPFNGDCYVWVVMDGAVQTKADHYVENGVSVYVANQAITSEFRPEHPKAPEPVAAPVAAPKEPEPKKGPIEKLESRLKPIETIPIKKDGDN